MVSCDFVDRVFATTYDPPNHTNQISLAGVADFVTRNHKPLRKSLRSNQVSSKRKEQRQHRGYRCLGLSSARRVAIHEHSGIRGDAKRNDGARKQQPIIARESPGITENADNQGGPESATDECRGKRSYDEQFPAHRGLTMKR
jgi:hypothetical protein